MTTATAEAPAAPPTLTPVEWVKTLPVEAREAVFVELLREVISVNGKVGRINIETEAEEYLGYFVTAEAERIEAERVLPKLSPEWMAELNRRKREGKPVPIRELIGKPIGEALPAGNG